MVPKANGVKSFISCFKVFTGTLPAKGTEEKKETPPEGYFD